MRLRKTVVCLTALLTSVAISAQEMGTAVLYSTGSVFLNGAQLSNTSAVTAGDVIQTKENGAANLNLPGSSAVVESNSIVRYRAEGLSLDRGNISVATGKRVSVFARDFKITPASDGWTEFYVTRTNGGIGILARKNPVTVNCGATTETVKEGQQISRADAADCGVGSGSHGARPAALGPIITPAMLEYGALIGGGSIAGWYLSQSDDPVSPSKP